MGPDMGFMTLEKRGRSVGTPASVTGDGDQQAVSAPAPAGVHLYSVYSVYMALLACHLLPHCSWLMERDGIMTEMRPALSNVIISIDLRVNINYEEPGNNFAIVLYQ